MNRSEVQWLRTLARWNGIQTDFVDANGIEREASVDALKGVLAAWGTPVQNGRHARELLRLLQQRRWTRCLDAVHVAWDCEPSEIEMRLPASLARKPLICQIRYEDGRTHRWSATLEQQNRSRPVKIEGASYVAGRFALPRLPWGYHQFELETSHGVCLTMIISAPTHSFSDPSASKQWGIFAPMYALHSDRTWGAGDFGEWRRLIDWTASLGGQVVATLPLTAAFLNHPFEPSPYSSASRLFWNEFYIDLTQVPELERCPAAQKLVGSPQFQKQIKHLRKSPLVDYREQMALKRQVLDKLADSFFSKNSTRRHDFQAFLREHPEWEEYARFRAVCDQREISWLRWPERLRDGRIEKGDFLDQTRRYHLYVQWLAQEQMRGLTERGRARGVTFYLDLPLGVNRDSYDVWRERGNFALGASGGAPPDSYFTSGQNWGFPPLHPQRIRESGYRHVLDVVRFQMRHAGLLRIDHVMGLHRLYWVPDGLPASKGAYVRYHAEEWHALLNLESHRNRTVLAGENLGIVPHEVNETMRRHHVRQLFVAQYEFRPNPAQPLPPPPVESVASLNTHDMPTFAAYWQGLDITERAALGLLKKPDLKREQRRREKLKAALLRWLAQKGWLKRSERKPAAVLEACLMALSGSSAEVLLITLEDLWLETLSQNVPTTSSERPNWRRKMRFHFDAVQRMPAVTRLLREIHRHRSEGGRA